MDADGESSLTLLVSRIQCPPEVNPEWSWSIEQPLKGSSSLDVDTRWKSTFLMLESAEKYEAAFDRYVIKYNCINILTKLCLSL